MVLVLVLGGRVLVNIPGNECILTEGGWPKTTPDKTFQAKNPGQNPPVKNLGELRQTPM